MSTKFLVFRLYGAMASWGEMAVGEQRPVTSHPSKSAIIGLLASALGIPRTEEAQQQALATAYGFAVCVDVRGQHIPDFHTIQKADKTARLKHLYTRRDELADSQNLATTLSRRDYWCDALYTVALWTTAETPPHSLTDLQAALHQPAFTLYLGRKSCPLALPVRASVLTADSLKTAWQQFDAQAAADEQTFFGGYLHRQSSRACYWDDGAPVGDWQALHSVPRNDVPISRRRWQFARRTEHYGTLEEA